MKASAIFPVLVLLAPLALAEPKQGVTGGEGTVSASKGGFSRRSDVQLPIDQKTIDRLEKEAEEAADALLKDPAKEIGPVLDKLDAIAQRELMYQLVAAMTRSERFDSEKMKKPMANLEASARYNLARLVKAYRDPKAPRRGFNPTDLIGVVLEQRAENEKLPNESLLQTNYLAQELKIADVENQTEKKIFERKDPALAIKHFESYRWYDPTKEADKVKKYGAAITEYLEKVFAVAATKPSEVPSALPALLFTAGDEKVRGRLFDAWKAAPEAKWGSALSSHLAKQPADRDIANALESVLEVVGTKGLAGTWDATAFERAFEKQVGKPLKDYLVERMKDSKGSLGSRLSAARYLSDAQLLKPAERTGIASTLSALVAEGAGQAKYRDTIFSLMEKNRIPPDAIQNADDYESVVKALLDSEAESRQVLAIQALKRRPVEKFLPRLLELLETPWPKEELVTDGPPPGAKRDYELSRTIPAFGEKTTSSAGRLRALVKDDKKRLPALRTLAAIGDTGSFDTFLDVCAQPKAKSDVRGYASGEQLVACEALAKMMQANPDLVSKERKKHIDRLLTSSDPALDTAQRVLRRYTDKAVKVEANRARADKAIRDKGLSTNACEHICGLLKKIPEWADDKTLAMRDGYFRPHQPPYSYELARKSLGFLFALKASKFCGDEARKTASAIESKWFKSAVTDRIKEPEKLEEQEEFRKKLIEAIGKDEVERVERSMAERLAAEGDKRPEPANSSEVFARVYYGRVLSSLPDSSKVEAKIVDARKATNAGLQKNIVKHHNKKYESIPESDDKGDYPENSGNSLMMTYLFAAGVIQTEFETAATQAEAVRRLIQTRDEAIKVDGDANAISYYLKRRVSKATDNEEEEGTGGLEKRSGRDGAARAVPTHLAIFLKDTDAGRFKENREFLRGSVRNYLDRFYEIFSGIGDDRTHDARDEHMAPYYGPATLPYVADALQLLENTAGSPGEKTKIREMRKELSRYIISMIEKDGLFRPQNDRLYPGAKAYDNALVGLTLTALLDHENDRCPDAAKPRAPLALVDDRQSAVLAERAKRAEEH